MKRSIITTIITTNNNNNNYSFGTNLNPIIKTFTSVKKIVLFHTCTYIIFKIKKSIVNLHQWHRDNRFSLFLPGPTEMFKVLLKVTVT